MNLPSHKRQRRKPGEVCVWSRKTRSGAVCRFLCEVESDIGGRMIVVRRWRPKVQQYVQCWALREDLAPATDAELVQYQIQVKQRRDKYGMTV